MKKFIIDESQKNEILKQHEDLKKSLVETVTKKIKESKQFLAEQSNPIFIDTRTIEKVKQECTKPDVKSLLTLFKGKPAIKVVGGPDDIKIYTNEPNTNFGGYNWYVLNTAETKILKGPFKWTCEVKKGPDPNAGDVTQEVAAGWTKREDLKNVSDVELADLYDPHPKYKNLYKLKVGKDKKGGFTADQQSFIDAWTASTPETKAKFSNDAYKINPDAKDFATGQWTRNNFFIAPGSEVYFPADEKGQKGLKIYINVNKLGVDPTRENCRAAIKTFVNMYREHLGGKEPDAKVFAETKSLVRLCKATVKFGGPFSKIDDDLKLLAGQTVDGIKGPTSLDSQNNPNPWRID
jgi:hypothetical protein